MESKLAELDPKTSAFKILVYLTFKDRPMKPNVIAKGLNENGSSVRARLAELKKKGLVDNTNEGYIAQTTTYDILMKMQRT
ncbi:MAG: DNA-binding protein [Candidatus Bathyarchaeota archaeon]|nr:DNA-binding protein [Candidatus Bathyarchaeota archaeon]